MSILPTFMQTQIASRTQTANVLTVPKEYGIDFTTGQLTGEIVEGIEAIKVWIWNCLHTQRFRYPLYSWDYGADLEQYIGQTVTEEFLNADCEDEIREALQVNPYITGIYSSDRIRKYGGRLRCMKIRRIAHCFRMC